MLGLAQHNSHISENEQFDSNNLSINNQEIFRTVSNTEIENFLQHLLEQMIQAHSELENTPIPNLKISLIDQNDYALASVELMRIFIDKKLFSTAKSVDEVFFVLAHEFSHFVYRWKEDPICPDTCKASIAEETWADYYAQKLATKAGYSEQSGAIFISALIAELPKYSSRYMRAFRNLNSLIDNHLDEYTRYEYLKNDFIGAERIITSDTEIGTAVIALTELPSSFKNIAAGIKFQSYFEKFCQITNYQEKNITDKLVFLIKHFPSSLLNQSRLDDFLELVSRLEEDVITNNFTHETLGHDFYELVLNTDKLIDKGQRLSKIYEFSAIIAARKSPDFQAIYPIGSLRLLEDSLNDFLKSENVNDASDAALAYLNNHPLIERTNNIFFQGYNAPTLILPNLLNNKEIIPIKYLDWISQDTCGNIFNLLLKRHFTHEREKLLDSLDLKTLETFQETVFINCKNYLLKRKELEKIKLPVTIEEILEDPKAWLENNKILLDCKFSEYGFLSKFHPFKKMSFENAIIAYVETWSTFCKALEKIIDKELLFDLLTAAPYHYSYEVRDRNPIIHFVNSVRNNYQIEKNYELIKKYTPSNCPISICRLLKIEFPKTFGEIWQLMKVIQPKTDHQKIKRSEITLAFFNVLANEKYSQILYSDHSNSEMSKFRSEVCNEFIAFLPLSLKYYQDEDLIKSLSRFCFEIYKQSNDPNQLKFDKLDLIVATEIYLLFEENQEYPDQTARKYWGDMVLNNLAQENDLDTRKEFAHKLLKFRSEKNLPIQDQILTSDLIEIYSTDCARQMLKDDDDSAEYLRKVNDTLWLWDMTISTRRNCCINFADKINAQYQLSQELEKKCEITDEELKKAAIPTKAYELLVKEAASDLSKRTALIHWLTSDGSYNSTEKFRTELEQWLSSYNGTSYTGKELINALLFGAQVLERDSYYRAEIKQLEAYSELDQTAQIKMQHLALSDVYQYFVSQPQEVQIIFIKQAILPAKEHYERGAEVLKEGCDIILNRILPMNIFADGSKDQRNLIWLRDFIETLIEVSHESERALILSALAAAARINDQSTEPPNLGKILADLLPQLGVAFIKLAQALDSSEHTPAEFKPYLRNAKGNINVPPAWDRWKLIYERLPKDFIEQEIYSLKEVSGAASINLVIYYLNMDKELRALRLKRRYADAQTKKGFDLQEKVINTAKCVANNKDKALEIIQHARKLADIELDSEIGPRQVEIQCQQYQNVSIQVNNHKFNFIPRAWLKHGEGWSSMEAAIGVPFDLLPENTPEEIAYKDAVAEAILLAELVNILRGKHLDYNRHERQYYINGLNIYPVDAGGMSIDLPEASDLKELGRLIRKLIDSSAQIEKFDIKIIEDDLAQWRSSDYGKSLEQALLYLSFAINRIKPERVKGIFHSALASGEVDPVVMKEIFGNSNFIERVKAGCFLNARLFPLWGSVMGYPVYRRSL